MITVAWPEEVNTKFYAYNEQMKDNVRTTENLSGRVVGFQKNTRNIMTFKCSLRLKKADELPAFWEWFGDTLGGTAGAFTCSALGDKNYRFVSVPSPDDTDQRHRVLSMEIEEVY